MAVSAKLYSNCLLRLANGTFPDLDAAGTVVKVALCTSSYTPDQNAHDYFDDIDNEVAEAGGYTAGGATLANKALTVSTTTTKFDADDVTWAASTITARYAIIYYSTGTASTSALIGYVDFGANQSSSTSNFTITWSASGIFTLTVA